jgi:amidase
MPPTPVGELCHFSARHLAHLLRSGQVSAREVLSAHLARIEAENPALNAIVTLTAERAMDQARAADRAFAGREPLGPLHGLPVAHKDLVDVAGVRTTYGSLLYRDHVPTKDHLLVSRMRAAGAVMVGKTNTPELGCGSQTHNRVFGATANPWDPTRTCGGSSGGAAVALATGMVALADGSDMGGSLRNPASFCGVVGLRPTPGRVPSVPARHAWFDLSVVGPMARDVEDAALLLSVLAGPDHRSPRALEQAGHVFTAPLERDFRGVRVAFSSHPWGLPFESEVVAIQEAQRARLEELGCVVEDAEPELGHADQVFRVLRGWHLATLYGDEVELGEDLVGPQVRDNVAYGRTVTAADLGWAEEARSGLAERMGGFWDRYEFFVLPVSQVLPFPIEEPWVSSVEGQRMPDYLAWMASCYLVSVLGAPAASVPAAFSAGGLPVGIQVVGRPRDDIGVLRLAQAFEQVAGVTGRWPPARMAERL